MSIKPTNVKINAITILVYEITVKICTILLFKDTIVEIIGLSVLDVKCSPRDTRFADLNPVEVYGFYTT